MLVCFCPLLIMAFTAVQSFRIRSSARRPNFGGSRSCSGISRSEKWLAPCTFFKFQEMQYVVFHAYDQMITFGDLH